MYPDTVSVMDIQHLKPILSTCQMLALPQVLLSTSSEGPMHSQDHTLQKSFARSCSPLCMYQIRAAP